MSSLSIHNMEGQEVGSVEIPASLQVTGKGSQAVRDAVVAYRANQRLGTACTKTKGEVAGRGGKPWRQKGTGNARAGYRQSPVWRGGGVVFGPKPRDFSKDVNRKTMRLALAKVISDRIGANEVMVVDTVSVAAPKTRDLASWLKKTDIKRGLIVCVEPSRELLLAARNIPGLEIARASHLNVYQAVRYPKIVLERGALDVLARRVSGVKEVAA